MSKNSERTEECESAGIQTPVIDLQDSAILIERPKATRRNLIPTAIRGKTNKPTIQPQIGNAWVAFQALGLPSPAALVKKFTREKNPWPSQFRTMDNDQWIYNIEGIRSSFFPTTLVQEHSQGQ